MQQFVEGPLEPLHAQILDRIEAIQMALPVAEFVGVSFISQKMGVSDQYLRTRFWLLPNLGRSEVPGRLLWSLRTVREWLKEKSPVEREREWQQLAPAQKAAIAKKRKML